MDAQSIPWLLGSAAVGWFGPDAVFKLTAGLGGIIPLPVEILVTAGAIGYAGYRMAGWMGVAVGIAAAFFNVKGQLTDSRPVSSNLPGATSSFMSLNPQQGMVRAL